MVLYSFSYRDDRENGNFNFGRGGHDRGYGGGGNDRGYGPPGGGNWGGGGGHDLRHHIPPQQPHPPGGFNNQINRLVITLLSVCVCGSYLLSSSYEIRVYFLSVI